MNDAPLLFSNFHIGREGTVCVCVWGGGAGESERERAWENFVLLRATPYVNTHCSEITEKGRPEASHECGMCTDDVSYIIPK